MSVTGIGGVFFRANDPKTLKAWYAQHLGVIGEGWTPWAQQAGPTLIVPFSQDTTHIPAGKQWMINFRVTEIGSMIATLRAGGIEVTTNPEWDTAETGKFARLHDPEGNAIELWEPPLD